MFKLNDIYEIVKQQLIKLNPETAGTNKLYYNEEHGDFKLVISATVTTSVRHRVYTFSDIEYTLYSIVMYSTAGRCSGALAGTVKTFAMPIE